MTVSLRNLEMGNNLEFFGRRGRCCVVHRITQKGNLYSYDATTYTHRKRSSKKNVSDEKHLMMMRRAVDR